MKLKCTTCNGLGYIEVDVGQMFECGICDATGVIDFGNSKPPYAYHVQNENAWDLSDVKDYYPEIVEYWNSKGISNICIAPCGPVDEDCLYLNDKWYSYCRHPYEWMQPEDLCDELKPPKGKQRRNCTI